MGQPKRKKNKPTSNSAIKSKTKMHLNYLYGKKVNLIGQFEKVIQIFQDQNKQQKPLHDQKYQP